MKFLLYGAVMLLGLSAAAQEIKVALFPLQETQIAARLDSIVMPYRFKTGEQFKKGEVICSLDSSRYQLEVDKMSNHYDFAKTRWGIKRICLPINSPAIMNLKRRNLI